MVPSPRHGRGGHRRCSLAWGLPALPGAAMLWGGRAGLPAPPRPGLPRVRWGPARPGGPSPMSWGEWGQSPGMMGHEPPHFMGWPPLRKLPQGPSLMPRAAVMVLTIPPLQPAAGGPQFPHPCNKVWFPAPPQRTLPHVSAPAHVLPRCCHVTACPCPPPRLHVAPAQDRLLRAQLRLPPRPRRRSWQGRGHRAPPGSARSCQARRGGRGAGRRPHGRAALCNGH